MKTLLILLALTLTGIITLAGFVLQNVPGSGNQPAVCQKGPSQTEYLVRKVWHHEGIDRMQICSLREETSQTLTTKLETASPTEAQARVLHLQGMDFKTKQLN